MTDHKLKVKALLIDLDGTLVDVNEALVEAAKQALATIGFQRVNPQIGVEIARQLQSNLSFDNLLHESGIVGVQKQEFFTAYLDAFHGLTLEKVKPISNVQTTLRTLAKHLSLALVTRRDISQKQLTKELQSLRFNSYFKTILTSQDVTQPQPSPEILLKAAQELRVPIEECAVVTDSIVDIQAGKAAGVQTIAVLTGLFLRKELEKWKPNFVIENINYLPDLLIGSEERF